MDVTTRHSGKLCGVVGTSAALAPMPAPPWRVGLGWWMGLACAPVRPRLPKVGHGRANCLRGFAHRFPCRPRPPMYACHGIVRTLLLAGREEPVSRATLGSWVDRWGWWLRGCRRCSQVGTHGGQLFGYAPQSDRRNPGCTGCAAHVFFFRQVREIFDLK